MLLRWTKKGTPGLRVVFFVPIMTVIPEIELQLPPTPQLKGRGSCLYMPYGSRDCRWLPVFLGSLGPVFGSIQVYKDNIQPDLSEVRLAEVKKKQKKTRETAVLIKAVYEMIDKRAILPVTLLEVYSYSLFLGISSEERTVSHS